MDSTNLAFNSLDFQDSDHITEQIDDEDTAQLAVEVTKLASNEGVSIVTVGWAEKIIKASGTITGTTISNLEANLDEFKGIVNQVGKNLDIDYRGGTRRYVATVTSCKISRPVRASAWAKWEVTWIIPSGEGKDTSATTETFSNKTTAPYTDTITIGGNKANRPKITVTLDSHTATGYQDIEIKNNTTGLGVKITRDWTNGDVIIVDPDNDSVTVNGDEVEFAGSYPKFDTGSQTILYDDTFSARQVDIEVVHTPRYW